MRTPSGRAVRPTPARVKEALFSILADRVTDANVLDLFAGTGSLGFEALSRGAAHATFVEQHRPTADALRDNARALGLGERTTVITMAAERAARVVTGRYDLVFADPPYAQPYPAATFASLHERGAIDKNSLVIYEHSAKDVVPHDENFRVTRTASYGAVALAFMTPHNVERAPRHPERVEGAPQSS